MGSSALGRGFQTQMRRLRPSDYDAKTSGVTYIEECINFLTDSVRACKAHAKDV